MLNLKSTTLPQRVIQLEYPSGILERVAVNVNRHGHALWYFTPLHNTEYREAAYDDELGVIRASSGLLE